MTNEPKKKGRGRPKKTLKDLPADWKAIIEREAKEGAGITEIRCAIGVFGDEAHKRLLKEEPEYSAAIKRGLQISENWWLKEGRGNLKNTKFSATLWYMNMKNRFGWKDRHEIGGVAEAPIRMVVVRERKA